MMVIRLTFAMLALALMAQPAYAQEALPIGAELPVAERTMQNALGAATSLAAQMGPRGLAVVFWCNTCPWVRRYEDRVVALANEYGAAGVGFIAINSNDPVAFPGDDFASMRTQGTEGNYGFPYVVDEGSQTARAFGATRTPQIFLFNSDGRLVYEGTVDDSPSDAGGAQERYFRDALASVVANAPVQVEKTKAFGCTIKFQD
jgi:thiol-disulfide isomerase/thioredoxin